MGISQPIFCHHIANLWHQYTLVSVTKAHCTWITSLWIGSQVEQSKKRKKKWPGGTWRLFWCHPSMTPDSGVMIWLVRSLSVDKWAMNISLYYINTNEILGELSHENLIFSHVKITCYLHMWKNHLCYGYITYRIFHTKKLLKWNGLVFYWCLYNK